LKRIEENIFAVTVKHITTKQIKSIEIPLPPLEIQKEIVEELEQYQKVIDGAKQVVDNYKPHIDIDESWEEIELGEICEFNYGKGLPKNDRKGEGYNVYGSNGIVGKHNNFLVEAPFIIVGRKGSSGVCHYSKSNGWPIDTTFYINKNSLKREILLEFLFYSLKSIDLTNISSEQTIPGLNRNDAYKKIICVPSLEIQKTLVKKIESEIEIIEGNKKLIEIYTQKIEDRINKIWGE